MSRETILTGLRANNDLTIGNYFGAIQPIVSMAKHKSSDYQVNMFIPDLHSFTTPINHALLYEQILHNARIFVAAGLPLDNQNIFMYRQSFIPAHSELTVLLNNFVGMGEMERMTQYKDKSTKLSAERISVGLFDYPVLMASDILLYDATYVPVGDDQTQHLEITRDIAQRINNKFGDIFTVPKPVHLQHEFFGAGNGLRITDLQDPTKKMSKSDDSRKGVIFLGDSPDIAADKIMSATTDDLASISFDRAAQPGISNLLELYALLTDCTVADASDKFSGMSRYGDFKQIVAKELAAFLADFQSKLGAVSDDAILDHMIKAEKIMRDQASQKLELVQRAVGLRPRG